LPLALCNVGVVVAAIACWWQVQLLVELTYFWGLAGTLQAVLTPDLNAGFPHLVFFQYLAGHLGIVLAALFLVVGWASCEARLRAAGLRHHPRVHRVRRPRRLADRRPITCSWPPAGEWTVLRLLGPWPWYLLSATVVALALITLLDMPFWPARRAARARAAGDSPTGSPSSATIGVERIERKQAMVPGGPTDRACVKGAQRTAEDEGASLHLHRWNSRAVVAVALIALASGFGQFGSWRHWATLPGSSVVSHPGTPWWIKPASRAASSASGSRSSVWHRSEACPSSGSPTGSGGARCCSAPSRSGSCSPWHRRSARVLVVRAIYACGRPMLSATNALSQVSAAEQTNSRDRSAAVALTAAGYGVGAGLIAVIHSLASGFLAFAVSWRSPSCRSVRSPSCGNGSKSLTGSRWPRQSPTIRCRSSAPSGHASAVDSP